ncbi:MAG: 50S ribosomal protein L29 [Nanobdellota archaeon]
MKYKEITKMSREERERKLKDLKLELIKSKTKATNTSGSNAREIKKTIAKILTINASKGGIEKK